MPWNINQNYNINIEDSADWSTRSDDELRAMQKKIHAKFNDAQILVNALNALDNELLMEIQDRELHPHETLADHPHYPTPTAQNFSEGQIMAPADAIQF